MQQDLVSVIMPVYNREEYVGYAISSILDQTYSNVEIVAVNDGSTDRSLEVLREFENKYPGKVVVIDQVNQGQVVSRNNAISQAKGQYIAFLDSDDLWQPTKLEKQMPLFNDAVGLVYCAVDNINEDGEKIDTELCESNCRGDIYPKLLVSNRMTGGTVVVKRDVIDKVGVFDTDFPAAENWDLWIRVCKVSEADFVDEPLVQYRFHPGNMSKDQTLMLSVIQRIIDKHCSGEPETAALAQAYKDVHASYAYRKGVFHFSSGEYFEARKKFREAQVVIPGYKDTRIRVFRTYLGRAGNSMLSIFKNLILRVKNGG